MQTSLLLIVFNRPDLTVKLLKQLQDIKPKNLYIAADGPRKGNLKDIELCQFTRELIDEKINWPCEVKKLYRTENLGCGKAVSGAITWFFNQVEEGIILEDDCIPNDSFFSFCGQLLQHYRSNEKIMHIGGTNFQDSEKQYSGCYYFSSIAHVWGWASWRRAWKKYCFDIEGLDAFIKAGKISQYHSDSKVIQYWYDVFRKMERHEIDTWDHQWTYSIWNNEGLTIIPAVNMVSNIGFDENATHTKEISRWANMQTYPMNKIVHPPSIMQDKEADIYTFYQHYSPSQKSPSLFNRILKRIV